MSDNEDKALPIDRRIEADITRAIYDQRMPPGTRLSEERLGELYEVSRTVVRKALFQLSSRKLVEIRPNRGARVAQPSAAQAREVFAARATLEAAMLEESMTRLTPADIAALRDTLAHDHDTPTDEADAAESIAESGDFHRALARLHGNTVLQEFLDELIGQTSLIIALYRPRDAALCSHDAHDALLDAIEAGDAATARRAMRAHLMACLDALELDPPQPAALADMLGRAR
ncbi:phosphoglycolate phosphatase protein [Salinisphaera shabanensis E1L3A]|uniref:Phosphoglycolate phosphatase protein n=1 Tax=Salinisphaera shabanensis E1L3A TaxID=1033802 RepID=U2EQC7_9GAMM|nr:GntR family transcriptional regulator [Salinisphaera shabanensis]ERJ19985.1 phosphoglycolate phosphatase protein [Salinisphaera shabanensis E1L3A]